MEKQTQIQEVFAIIKIAQIYFSPSWDTTSFPPKKKL